MIEAFGMATLDDTVGRPEKISSCHSDHFVDDGRDGGTMRED